MKVEVYSDVACPWCYIGKQRFERALSAYPGGSEVEVVYRPYQLDPQAPSDAVPMREYLERRFGPGASGMTDRVVEAAREEGLTMDYDRGLAANTLDAHRVLRLAEREHGPAVQRALAARLFEAHFAEGRDIGDAAVLVELAGEAGMEPDRVRAYLASGEGRAEVREEIAGAQHLGISAVPTFVFEQTYAVQGAQPASVFLQTLEAVAQQTGTDRSDGDACTDGSCAAGGSEA